ncbi:membrane protein implicated in regulation of membrane protease activity [Sanguibacter antarcticus]|uniref:Membrane protein implicated in regulation of membrane protease activity n=2 Tax=Sanguibacter antarcticus TaxID=372484 RepID=A0A2A9E2W9_9MICO|nr:membrane protein implicated in regulation of membrane protease activity [Sanguibacter antarcticus]
MDWYWWIGTALILVVVEMVSLDLVLMMFAGGAVAAGVGSALGADLAVQILLFGVVSTLLLFAIRPWLLKYLRQRTPLTETNAAAQVGRIGVVVAEVTDDGGRIKLFGEVWSARSAGDVTYPLGSDVVVVRIDGATAIVGSADAPVKEPHRPELPA